MIDTILIMSEELSTRKATDDGALGDAYEIATRSYISGRRVRLVKGQGKPDITFTMNGKHYRTEVKHQNGELNDNLLLKNQYIIFAPVVDPTQPAEKQGYVFTREDWEMFLTSYTGRGQLLKYDTSREKYHLQSYYISETKHAKASKPIARYIWDFVSTLPTVEEFFEGR